MAGKKPENVSGTGVVLLPEEKLLMCKPAPLSMVDSRLSIGNGRASLRITGEKEWLSWTARVQLSLWLLPTGYAHAIAGTRFKEEAGWLNKLCESSDAIRLPIYENQTATGGQKVMEFFWDLAQHRERCTKNRVLAFHVSYERIPLILKDKRRRAPKAAGESTPLLL
jgi:hypothetical protein